MRKIAVLLMTITIFSKAFGFLRDVTLSYFYGASGISDAYIISLTITSVLFSIIFAGISMGYIALYNQIEIDIGEKLAKRFTNNLVNIVLVISTVLIVFGYINADLLVNIFGFGFDDETTKIAIILTRIGLIGIYCSSLTQLFMSHLQLNEKFAVTVMISFPYNMIIILSIYVSAHTNIYVLAIGTVIATLAQLLFLIPSLINTKYKYEAVLHFKDKNIKKMVYYVYPIMIGMSINNINLMVDKSLASRIIEGGISSLEYASRLNGFVHGIFVLSFVTVMFPVISKLAANKNIEDFKKIINQVISCVILLVIPASIGVMILAEPIIKLLYGRGSFDEKAILLTSQALYYYSIGMVGYGVREVLLRSFYSLQDMKTPMYNASIAVILNIILSLILSIYMGIGGLALATSISVLFSVGLLLISLRKKIGPLGLRSNVITLLKVMLASIVMGSTIFVLKNYVLVNWNGFLKVGTLISAGVTIYLIIIVLLKVEETKILIKILIKRESL